MEDQDKISNCLICTIADNLKACNACAFSAGLPFRLVKSNEVLSADHLLRIEEIRVRFKESITDFNLGFM